MARKFDKNPNNRLENNEQNSNAKEIIPAQNESEGDKKEGEAIINKQGQSNSADSLPKKPKYLQLNITDYQDYISLMAEHEKAVTGKYMSMTKYILQLIEADKQKNIELYTKLEDIEKMKREII